MSILQKYLFREWLLTFIAVSLVLVVVLLGMFMGELLRDIANGRMPISLLGIQVLLRLPDALGDILPLSLFIAVMWGLGRLYRDQEMSVMRSNGFTWRMMLRPLALLAAPLALGLLLLDLLVTPRAMLAADDLVQQALQSGGLWGVQAGRFHVLDDGDLVLYVGSLAEEGLALEEVFIHRRFRGREQVWYASEGRYLADPDNGARYLTLLDGQVTESTPDGLDFRVMEFARNDVRLPEPEIRPREAPIQGRPSADLLQSTDADSRAELQWRLAPAVAALVLGLLAIPLSHSGPREGRAGRVVLGILVYVVYSNLLYLCRAWIADGSLPPGLGMWWVHAVVLGLTLVWLQRQGRMPARRRGSRARAPS